MSLRTRQLADPPSKGRAEATDRIIKVAPTHEVTVFLRAERRGPHPRTSGLLTTRLPPGVTTAAARENAPAYAARGRRARDRSHAGAAESALPRAGS